MQHWRPRHERCANLRTARALPSTSTTARDVRAAAAAPRSARGRWATPRAWRTGARLAKEERTKRRSNEGRGFARSTPLPIAARLLSRRLPRALRGARRRGRAALLLRRALLVRTPCALRVPAARADVPRVPRQRARKTRRRAACRRAPRRA